MPTAWKVVPPTMAGPITGKARLMILRAFTPISISSGLSPNSKISCSGNSWNIANPRTVNTNPVRKPAFITSLTLLELLYPKLYPTMGR